MYAFLRSKRGYSLVEVIVVILVMSVLVAVAVPVYRYSSNKNKTADCKNQITIVQGWVSYVMNGMQDNGVKLTMMAVNEGTVYGSGTAKYWILSKSTSPTVGNMRVGATCAASIGSPSDYLKKSAMDTTSFKTLLTNAEVPVCPFDTAGTYGYRIYMDGHVTCNCPDCPNYVA